MSKYTQLSIISYQLVKILILLTTLLLLTGYNLQPIFAAKLSPSPTPTSDPIQQKLSDLQSEIASKAAALKSVVSQKIQNKAYIGTISNLDTKKNTIILSTPKGDRQVSVDEYTAYQDNTVSKQSKNFGLNSLRENDTLVALGDVDDKNILSAKKVIKVKALDQNTNVATWGKITSVFPSSIDIADRNNQKVILNLTGNTLIRFNNNQDATLSDIKPGSLLISIGSPAVKQTSKAYFIYLFVNALHSPSASPSAKLATPSAQVKLK